MSWKGTAQLLESSIQSPSDIEKTQIAKFALICAERSKDDPPFPLFPQGDEAPRIRHSVTYETASLSSFSPEWRGNAGAKASFYRPNSSSHSANGVQGQASTFECRPEIEVQKLESEWAVAPCPTARKRLNALNRLVDCRRVGGRMMMGRVRVVMLRVGVRVVVVGRVAVIRRRSRVTRVRMRVVVVRRVVRWWRLISASSRGRRSMVWRGGMVRWRSMVRRGLRMVVMMVVVVMVTLVVMMFALVVVMMMTVFALVVMVLALVVVVVVTVVFTVFTVMVMFAVLAVMVMLVLVLMLMMAVMLVLVLVLVFAMTVMLVLVLVLMFMLAVTVMLVLVLMAALMVPPTILPVVLLTTSTEPPLGVALQVGFPLNSDERVTEVLRNGRCSILFLLRAHVRHARQDGLQERLGRADALAVAGSASGRRDTLADTASCTVVELASPDNEGQGRDEIRKRQHDDCLA